MANEPINAKEQPANRDQASDTGIEDRIEKIRARLEVEYGHLSSYQSLRSKVCADMRDLLAALDAKDVQIETLRGNIKAVRNTLYAEMEDHERAEAEQRARAEHAEAALSACQREAESDREALVDERNHWIREQRKAETALLQMREALDRIANGAVHGSAWCAAVAAVALSPKDPA